MHILIAPDSFKDSLTAEAVANAIEAGFLEAGFFERFPKGIITKLPVADGGEGTMPAMIAAMQGEILPVVVHDPLMRKITANYGWVKSKRLAIIEMAESSGLMRLSTAERNPLVTSSFGTGELILDALNQGATSIILAIGGSATNDGGAGMLRALGAKLLDAKEEPLPEGGAALRHLAKIDLSQWDARLAHVQFDIACDVDNPLTGNAGASAIFGPQKGASNEDVRQLDQALSHYADITASTLGIDVRDNAGSGAAGGMGFAGNAFLQGRLKSGIEIVLDAVGFAQKVQQADLVITGEGKIDAQSIYGKTPVGVAQLAKKYDKPVIAIAGNIGEGASLVYEKGIDALFSITQRPEALEVSLLSARENIIATSRNIARLWCLQTGV